MELNVGIRSAVRQGWSTDHEALRDLVMKLLEGKPSADRNELVKIFKRRAKGDDEWLHAAVDYAVGNMLTQIMRHQAATARLRDKPLHEIVAREEQKAAMVADIKAQILLLNLEMPNGKRMRHCTGAEMGKFGAAYKRIAAKVGKTKTVGEVLDETSVRQLMA